MKLNRRWIVCGIQNAHLFLSSRSTRRTMKTRPLRLPTKVSFCCCAQRPRPLFFSNSSPSSEADDDDDALIVDDDAEEEEDDDVDLGEDDEKDARPSAKKTKKTKPALLQTTPRRTSAGIGSSLPGSAPLR